MNDIWIVFIEGSVASVFTTREKAVEEVDTIVKKEYKTDIVSPYILFDKDYEYGNDDVYAYPAILNLSYYD